MWHLWLLPPVFFLATTAAQFNTTYGPVPDLESPPNVTQTYIIRRYAPALVMAAGAVIFGVPVTDPSSGGEYTIFCNTGPASGNLVVLPHLHKTHYETFFNFKGRVNVWAQRSNREQEARVLTTGDFGSWPPFTNHTFQCVDPDSELHAVVAPGGFERLISAIAVKYNTTTNGPFDPAILPPTNGTGDEIDPEEISMLESLDVWAQPGFTPRRDILNGTAPHDRLWHNGFNNIGNDSDTNYWIANNYGPKYLDRDSASFYHVVQPLVTPQSTGPEYNLTESTITINGPPSDMDNLPTFSLPHGNSFEVLEGRLTLMVEGFDPAQLYWGDLIYIPRNTKFSYHTKGIWAKFRSWYLRGGLDVDPGRRVLGQSSLPSDVDGRFQGGSKVFHLSVDRHTGLARYFHNRTPFHF